MRNILVIFLFALLIGNAFSMSCWDISKNPIPICDCDDLNKIRLFLDHNLVLENNIDCSETKNWNFNSVEGYYEGFQPISSSSNKFSGTLVGNNHEISNLYINGPKKNYIGLFGVIDGNISDVGLVDVNITGYSWTGGLVGLQLGGVISNSYSSGNVSGVCGSIYTGGLVGYKANGIISNSYSSGKVNGANFVGGLIGATTLGDINGSYSTNDINIFSCVYGELISYGGFCGGLVGTQNSGLISNSYSSGTISGSCSRAGGLVGSSLGKIYRSYSEVNLGGHSYYLGGLVGYSYVGGEILDSYATGDVIGSGDYVGGLTGAGLGNIRNSYSTGIVVGSGDYVGGLSGHSYSKDNISNSYWDLVTSNQLISSGGEGKTTLDMQKKSTFIDWDFDNTWDICLNYPTLKWQGLENCDGINEGSENSIVTLTVNPSDGKVMQK